MIETNDTLTNEVIFEPKKWTYKGKEMSADDIDEMQFENKKLHGFIYMITEKSSGKIYIGQKKFFTTKVRSVKKKKKKVKVQSDWQKYFSSSTYIKEEVEKGNHENYERKIIALCISDGQMNYIEMKLQMDLRVLERQDLFLNAYIGSRIATSHTKFNELIDYDKDEIDKLYALSYFGFENNS